MKVHEGNHFRESLVYLRVLCGLRLRRRDGQILTPEVCYPPISSQASTALRPAASVMRLPALAAISMTCIPRSK